ncbi:hypothetical protein Aph01nite_40050 [Acrocarpospora phusangensis]|uniref:Glycosyltransferase 2-like domain-containing protein n=1 Tax=Acrocarpospora phusangensis TaxID=1070424 RepID=A0A919QE41_9ACTN|nr:hypothetical protein [Acrocarpospora phusangensis]GIH25695.1 hypothetical protein Aph01nite_40050 [Acrocarpospora phusangensis]
MSELESVRRALAQAVEQAAGAAELARLLVDYQARLDEAARTEADALTRAKTAEARLRAVERQAAQLAKHLAEQRYLTEVAQWKLESVQGSRWSQLGDAIQTKNPGTVARTLKAPVKKRPAPKRSDFTPDPVVNEGGVAPVVPDSAGPAVSTPLAESFVVPKGPLVRPYLTVAAIVDRQTEALMRYEWRQVTNFGPENWQAMLEEHQPHVLFVESVRPGPRQGNGGRWLEAMDGQSRALRDLVEACKKRGVKTVYWHSSGSVGKAFPAAELFEYVLATSEPRAREWRSALRHDRVGVLPHTVQPRVHNQIPAAGGRTGEIRTLGSVEGEWEPLIGQSSTDKSSYDDVLTAYRQPAAVLAGVDADPRVIAEIEACGTPVVRLAGAKPPADLGEAVPNAHLAWRATTAVTPYLDPIMDTIGVPSVRNSGVVTAIAAVASPGELDHLVAQLARQLRRPEQLVIVADGLDAGLVEKSLHGLDVEAVIRTAGPLTRGAALDRALRLADGDHVAVFDPRDLYGEHYLADALRHFAATDAEIIGKASCYIQVAGATLLRQPGTEHRFLAEVAGGTLLARRPALQELGFADVTDDWDEVLMRQARADAIRVYSADRYSYVCVREIAEGRLFASAALEGYVPAESLALF